MKIGFVAPYTNCCPPVAYGGEIFYWGLVDTLGKLGHEVHLLAPDGSKTPTGGFLHVTPKAARGQLDPAIEIEIEKKYHNILMSMDIVHDCSMSHIAAERLNYLYGKKEIINTINGSVYHEPRPPFNVVTGSLAWQAEAKFHGLNTEMIYWGVDTDFYTPGGEREDWFLWLARFHPDKGLDLALDLAMELNLNLKVAGSMEFADHERYGQDYLKRIKGISNVEYVPLPIDETHHARKRDLYRRAKGFIYPVNYFECFGLVVAESLSCGCPVITFNAGAMPEIVVEGTGIVCDTPTEMRNILEKPLGFDGGESLHSHIVTNFSLGRAAKSYEKLYQEVINGKRW